MPTILAIESSCDDTSAAVVADGVVLSNVTAGQAVALPPVELGDARSRHAEGLQMRAHAQRGDEGHAGLRQLAHRRVVEVVVVVVGDHHRVELRQCVERDRRLVERERCRKRCDYLRRLRRTTGGPRIE